MAGPPPDPKFPDVLERHRAQLLRIASLLLAQRLRSRLDPDDLVQETFYEAWCAHNDGRACLTEMADRAAFAYLLTVLQHNATDEGRRRAPEGVPRRAFDESSMDLVNRIVSEETSPSVRAERAEQFLRLAGAIAELPDAQRVAVVMRYLRGLRVTDIAAEMKRSPDAVSQLIFRALAALRGALPDPTA